MLRDVVISDAVIEKSEYGLEPHYNIINFWRLVEGKWITFTTLHRRRAENNTVEFLKQHKKFDSMKKK
jgi:hypothetical protein